MQVTFALVKPSLAMPSTIQSTMSLCRGMGSTIDDHDCALRMRLAKNPKTAQPANVVAMLTPGAPATTLSGGSNELLPDTRTPGAAVGSDPAMATVGTFDGTEVRKG